MNELEVCWKNVGIDSSIVSELFYQIYYMGIYKASGEDEIIIPESDIPEPIPPIEPIKPREEYSFSDDFDLSFAIYFVLIPNICKVCV